MAAVSPKPHSPRTTINDWDEAAVHTWLVSIGVDKYEAVIHGE
jgi:hypothetical protein